MHSDIECSLHQTSTQGWKLVIEATKNKNSKVTKIKSKVC